MFQNGGKGSVISKDAVKNWNYPANFQPQPFINRWQDPADMTTAKKSCSWLRIVLSKPHRAGKCCYVKT